MLQGMASFRLYNYLHWLYGPHCTDDVTVATRIIRMVMDTCIMQHVSSTCSIQWKRV